MKNLILLLCLALPWTTRAATDSESCQELLQPNPLVRTWNEASRRAPRISASLKDMTPAEAAYFKPVLAAVTAALGKHQNVFARERHLKHLDVPRHMAILSAIAEFDEQRPRFALYKIKRTIEGRHSLREYIDCRE
jgi:hypothetical protein